MFKFTLFIKEFPVTRNLICNFVHPKLLSLTKNIYIICVLHLTAYNIIIIHQTSSEDSLLYCKGQTHIAREAVNPGKYKKCKLSSFR